MKKYWLLFLLIFLELFDGGRCFWVGEQFWTIIDSDGSFRDQRTITDFISFKADEDIDDRYIAYWITPHCDGQNQFEAYGDAYFVENGKLCAKFIDKNNHPIEVCGGFRILSINSQDQINPFEWRSICDILGDHIAAGLNHHIVRIWQNDRFQYSVGGVHLDRGRAYAVDVNGNALHIFRANATDYYCSNIDLLVIRDGYVAKEYVHVQHGEGRHHRHRNNGHIFTPDDSLNPPCAGPCIYRDSSIVQNEPPVINPPEIDPPEIVPPVVNPPVYNPPMYNPPPQHSPPSLITTTEICDEWKLQIRRYQTDMEYNDGYLKDCQSKLKSRETEIIQLKDSHQTYISDEYFVKNLEKENENLRHQISRLQKFEKENEQFRSQISQITVLENTVTRLEYDNQRLKKSIRVYESQKIKRNRELVDECERKAYDFERQLKFVREDLSKERYRNDDLTSENDKLRREIEENSHKEQQWERTRHDFKIQKQDSCDCGEIIVLKQKLIFEEQRSEERQSEIQRLNLKLVNLQESKLHIENQLLLLRSEQKSWNQKLLEARRNCNGDGNGGDNGFLQTRIRELEVMLKARDQLIAVLKKQKVEIQTEFEKMNGEFGAMKNKYVNLETVLIDVEKAKKDMEEERDALKTRIETLEADCGHSSIAKSGIAVIKNSGIEASAQRSDDRSGVATKEGKCDTLIRKARSVYNSIQESSDSDETTSMIVENDDDKFIEMFDIFILQAWKTTKTEINSLKLQQKIYITQINTLKNDIQILQHSEDNFEEGGDDAENEDGNGESRKGVSILRQQLHSYELEVSQYRRDIQMLKVQLKNTIKIKYECKSNFQKFQASQNKLVTVFKQLDNYFTNSSYYNYNQTRFIFFELKEIVLRQTIMIEKYNMSWREKKDASFSYEESSSWYSGNAEENESEYYEEESSSLDTANEISNWENEYREEYESKNWKDSGFDETDDDSQTTVYYGNKTCHAVTKKYQALISKVRLISNTIFISTGLTVTKENYLKDDDLLIKHFDEIFFEAWNTSKLEVAAYRLEKETCVAEIDMLKNDMKNFRHQSESNLFAENCTRHVTFLEEKLNKCENGDDTNELLDEAQKSYKFVNENSPEFRNAIKDQSECDFKIGQLESTQKSFMSFYHRFEEYLLKSDCEKATSEILQFRQKINNQSATITDIVLHQNEAMPQKHEETYELLNKIKTEISTLQKDLCDYRKNNSALVQIIVERNDEMENLRDSENLCKFSLASLNETNLQITNLLSQKENETEELKKEVDVLLQNQTLTKQIESILVAEPFKNEDVGDAKCDGLKDLLQDLLVLLKRNKETCEEKFLGKIDGEEAIREKRAAKRLKSIKKTPRKTHHAQPLATKNY